ncbi:LOW QUALITY PROTEIN: arylsulfatase B-like [Pomacea canaliculata]|uniref:LOW QUALITY PROTEIN: arylsulfatase B-like n=1 Tax=Pomacea canaliculata TaxID=400727 RepID=UPI000D732F0C|nr:LOW QUALITY PROTEIN: arylsulfatase B-like [Pomacea canaliculata]
MYPRPLHLGLLLLAVSFAVSKQPHIVFIVIDDLGWNDIGFNNPDIISPNVDRLAREGLILRQSYVQPLCSPSRSSFMTGYFPYRTGLQHLVILPAQPVCAPLNVSTFLPREMKKLGYATHMVGKWHLGFCNWNCTPTFRGFDSFLGYYNAQEDYYDRVFQGYYDFHDNTTRSTKQNGTYSTFVFQERVREIVSRHNPAQPLFLYLPLQSVHAPLEVPKEYYNMYPNIDNEDRRVFSGMVTAMDDVIGNLTSYLTARGMYNDTLFVLTADNGGGYSMEGNNYPLRGGKFTVWEGGTRAVALIKGPGLKVTGAEYDGLIHAVDWMPTIVAAAGGEIKDGDIDGMNIWDAISNYTPSPRTEFIYNLDDMFIPLEGHAAIRQGDYKLIVGFPGLYSGWYFPNETVSKVDTMNTSDLSGLTMAIPQQDSLSWPELRRKFVCTMSERIPQSMWTWPQPCQTWYSSCRLVWLSTRRSMYHPTFPAAIQTPILKNMTTPGHLAGAERPVTCTSACCQLLCNRIYVIESLIFPYIYIDADDGNI